MLVADVFGKISSLHTRLSSLITFARMFRADFICHPVVDVRNVPAMPASTVNEFTHALKFYFRIHRVSLLRLKFVESRQLPESDHDTRASATAHYGHPGPVESLTVAT